MGLLNEDVAYDDIATSQSRDVFLPETTPGRELLHTGTRLCFFTPALDTSTASHQWWILLNPFLLSSHKTAPGIGEFLYRSGCRINSNHRLITPQGVKVCCAEPQSRFVLVALTQSVFGYVGVTKTHRAEPNGGFVPLPGGEYRVWIPGMSSQHVQRLPIPRELQYVVADAAGTVAECAAQEPDAERQDEHAKQADE